MGVWDVIGGVFTGGVYTAIKTVFDVGHAASKIGESAGSALNAVSGTVSHLGEDLSSFIKELEELLTIERLTPRDADDLWDEEVERLNALRQQEAVLVQQLADLDAQDDNPSLIDIMIGFISGGIDYEELLIRSKLKIIRDAIKDILYNEPGVVPSTIHNVQYILERFNTLEQPQIEEILCSVNDNLTESEELIQEINKLFVIKKWEPIAVSDLSADLRAEIKELEVSIANYDELIKANASITSQLQTGLQKAHPAKFEIKKIEGLPRILGGTTKKVALSQIKTPTSLLNASDAARITIDKPGTDLPGSVSGISKLKGLGDQVEIGPKQPMAMSLATELNQNCVSGFMNNFTLYKGYLSFYQREKLKLEKKIFRLQYILVEKPGVIPKILEEIRSILNQFHTSNQPRIDTILESVNGTVLESTNMITNINTSLMSIQNGFDFLKKNNLLIKICAAVAGGLFLLILLTATIILFRLAFGL